MSLTLCTIILEPPTHLHQWSIVKKSPYILCCAAHAETLKELERALSPFGVSRKVKNMQATVCV
jgi:hypothetical protein